MDINNYGYTFNNITIKDEIFNKKAKNKLGIFKINNEIDFYLYIIKNNIYFPIPELLEFKNGEISIKYIKNSSQLTNKINFDNLKYYLNKIEIYLNILHNQKITVSSNIIQKDLIIEIEKKILDRYNEYDWNNCILFKSIKYVNNVKINSIEFYIQNIKKKLIKYLENRNYYNLIHGDIHLGNILIDSNDKLYFIDPRGYFGESKLFGLYEYDYAKLLFGLSGYSVFDNMIIDNLNIVNNNLEINFIKNYEHIFKGDTFDKITKLLCLSIWLGNNNCFSNINKKVMSLMIAL